MRIGLFIPCFIDGFAPEVGIATLELLERFGHEVIYPRDQTCCGQPMANSGFQAESAATESLFNRPVDQTEAAARFIAAPEHEKMHDERLWDLRQKRDREMHMIPEWESLRALASAIKEHTLTHLDEYLEEFEANARSNGIVVHWARDAAEHNHIVHGILKDHGARSLIKSKSMLTEECGFRPYMAAVGIEVIETDLGERIQQLDKEDPSHIVVPAVHKLRTDVAEVFSKSLGTDPRNSDVHYLAEAQREATRPLILAADAGMRTDAPSAWASRSSGRPSSASAAVPA